jgi:type II secretory pathway predicted ATPase ExeA/cell division septation protein DedD
VSTNYSKKAISLAEAGPQRAPSLLPFQSETDLATNATLTYEPHFGLDEKPFSLNADARFVYDSPSYGATRDRLVAGIRRREGLLVLTGEIGTGKTTLCRAVLRNLGRKTHSAIIPDPFASREDLLKMMLIDFGVLTIEALTEGRLRQASRTELGYVLAEFLNSLAADCFAVVILDEAQNLTLPLIEETRILSDTFGAKGRLQIVFVGQPELQAKLKLPELRQVDQRVCGYHRLAPMDPDAVAGYINYRLQVAGASRDRVLFPPAIIDSLHRRTGGVPRLINRVCDRALSLACERGADVVNQDILDAALIELGAATLSPTWDAIVFAEASAPQAVAAAPAPPAGAVAPATEPAPVAAPAPIAIAPLLDDEDDFEQLIDNWTKKELGPTAPRPAAPSLVKADVPRRRPAASTAPKRELPKRDVKNDWPSALRSETYMQRLMRVWGKRAALVVFGFIAINAALVAVSQLPGFQDTNVIPPLTEIPATANEVSPLPSPVRESRPSDEFAVAMTETPAAPALASGDYLVVVGLFASRERADALVDQFTEADLPAMQRPFTLGQREVQQIVLGPFFSRAEALDDLRRLQTLGDYQDARVVTQ